MTTDHRPPTWVIRSSEDVGRTISDLRRRRGLTQEELARQSSISRNYLAQLETGLTVALLERVLRLFRRLGAEVTVSLRHPGDDG